MHEVTGDLFDHNNDGPSAICITTNGFVNTAGANTMGAGCALEAKQRWPGIQMLIGSSITHGGNDTRVLTTDTGQGPVLPTVKGWPARVVPYHILMFPTKPQVVEARHTLLPQYQGRARQDHAEDVGLPGWLAQSDIQLIARSANQLAALTDQLGWKSVVLPRPGCGKGGLAWGQKVKPVLAEILDERFYVISFK